MYGVLFCIIASLFAWLRAAQKYNIKKCKRRQWAWL